MHLPTIRTESASYQPSCKISQILFPGQQKKKKTGPRHHYSLLKMIWLRQGQFTKYTCNAHSDLVCIPNLSREMPSAAHRCGELCMPQLTRRLGDMSLRYAITSYGSHSFLFIYSPCHQTPKPIRSWSMKSTTWENSNLWKNPSSLPDTYNVQTCNRWLYVVSHSNAKLPG